MGVIGAALGVTQLSRVGDDKAVAGQLLPTESKFETSQQQLLSDDSSICIFPESLLAREKHEIAKLLAGMPVAETQDLLDELAGAIDAGAIKSTPVRWFIAVLARYKAGQFQLAMGIRVAARRAGKLQKAQTAVPEKPAAKPTAEQRAILAEMRSQILHKTGKK